MRVPVTVVTGFLGAGKTTLINRLLVEGALEGAALIVNEFGEIGIDGHLFESVDETLMAMSGGCLCCTIRGDLADTFDRLLARDPAPGRILIETTGIADPVPILQSIAADPRLTIAGVVTLVDATAPPPWDSPEPEAQAQLAAADLVVITKGDLADDAALAALNGALVRHAPLARIVTVAAVEPQDILAPDSEGKAVMRREGGRAHRHSYDEGHRHGHRHDHGHDHRHDHGQGHDRNRHGAVEAARLEMPGPVAPHEIEALIDLLRSSQGERLLRLKGLLPNPADPDRPLVLQGVRGTLSPPRTLQRWPDGVVPGVHLVAITRDAPAGAVQRLFDAFAGRTASETPDRAALIDNPLAVPGVRF